MLDISKHVLDLVFTFALAVVVVVLLSRLAFVNALIMRVLGIGLAPTVENM